MRTPIMAMQDRAPCHQLGMNPAGHSPELFSMARSSQPGGLDQLVTFGFTLQVIDLLFMNQTTYLG